MTPDYLFILSGNRFQKINTASLLYIKKKERHTEIVTTNGNIVTRIHLDQVEKSLLPSRLFCRVNDECLVAIGKIISFDQKAVQLPGICIPLGKKYIGLLKEKIRIIDSRSIPSDNPEVSKGRIHFSCFGIDHNGRLCRIGI